MNVLLVQPLAPKTYWGFQYAVGIVGKGAPHPPLGLATLAALLPGRWNLRILDLNVAPFQEEDLRWADAVLVTGMLVHSDSMHAVISRAHRSGVRTVVGGPAASSRGRGTPGRARRRARARTGAPSALSRRRCEARHVYGPGAALRSARSRALHLDERAGLARLPVPVRVLRHHRAVRAQSQGEVAGAGPARARRALPARLARLDLRRRRQLHREPPRGGQAPAGDRALAGRAPPPLRAVHRGERRSGRIARAGRVDGDGRLHHGLPGNRDAVRRIASCRCRNR